MICKNCGFEIKENKKFCMNCGAAVHTEHAISEQILPVEEFVPDTEEQLTEFDKSDFNAEEPSELTSEEYSAVIPENNVVHQQSSLAEPFSRKKMTVISVAAVLAVMLIIIGIAAFKNLTETKELEAAIESKNASSVNAIYDEARGNISKIKKYDAVIGKLIDDMIADINSYNFDDDALVNTYGALDNYAQNRWGTMMISFNTDLIYPSVSSINSEKYNELGDLEDSKYNYCGGLYEYKTDNDYLEAISYFSKVIESDSKFEDVKTMIGECTDLYINEVLTAVEEKVSEDDVSGGLDLLNNAKERLDSIGVSSEEILNKINETIAAYAEKYAAKAEEAFKQKDVDAAIGNIEVALELQPDNADYKIKYDTYQQYLPFYLYKTENIIATDNINADWKYFDTHNTANDNTEMEHVINVGYGNYNVENIYNIQYNLAGKYDLVSGKIFIPDTYKSKVQTAYIEAYGDGKLLYTSPKVEKGVLPQNIIFNVSEIQKLEIKFYARTDDTLWSSEVGISNLTAQKAFPEE